VLAFGHGHQAEQHRQSEQMAHNISAAYVKTHRELLAKQDCWRTGMTPFTCDLQGCNPGEFDAAELNTGRRPSGVALSNNRTEALSWSARAEGAFKF